MKLTTEQQTIINSTPDPGRPLVVVAFAGTGKTFTLERYAEARPDASILYAAFNKAIQLEAERKMPGNVLSKTTHSLAWRAIGSQYQRADKLKAGVPVWRISRYLGASIVVANFAFEVVRVYLASADEEIGENHIPSHIVDYYAKEEKVMPPLVEMAKGIWESMCSFGPNSLPMVHDGYLKLWQLSRPELPYDYILLDEAQDTTPCVWDVMIRQRARKVVVGDPHQAIYGWRGAIDALNLVGESEFRYLTQSFRFGPDVAALASTLLRRFKGEEKELKGLSSLRTNVTTGTPKEDRVVIARGNALIFRSSAYECEFSKRNLGYVGGDHKNYRFQVYADVYNLYVNNRDAIRDAVIGSFTDYDELKEYADKIKSVELQGACQVVEEYKGRIPFIMRDVAKRDVGQRYANLSYSTGHKAKGLEFPIVQMANDFWAAIEHHREVSQSGVVPDDELNLLYVAITRATETLYIPSELKSWVETGSNESRKMYLNGEKGNGYRGESQANS